MQKITSNRIMSQIHGGEPGLGVLNFWSCMKINKTKFSGRYIHNDFICNSRQKYYYSKIVPFCWKFHRAVFWSPKTRLIKSRTSDIFHRVKGQKTWNPFADRFPCMDLAQISEIGLFLHTGTTAICSKQFRDFFFFQFSKSLEKRSKSFLIFVSWRFPSLPQVRSKIKILLCWQHFYKIPSTICTCRYFLVTIFLCDSSWNNHCQPGGQWLHQKVI